MTICRKVLPVSGLILSIFFSPLIAAAQGVTTTGDWGVLRNVPTDSKLVIKLKNGKTVEGKLQNVSDSSLNVVNKNSPTELKREEIATVHQITKKSPTAATLIGMGIGAGAGAGLGAIAASNDNNDFDKIDHAATAGLAVIGAGVGAITGYLIGKRGNKRILLYESK
jgi:small nuclear ribonucleoprotein (snRNP)-like protein